MVGGRTSIDSGHSGNKVSHGRGGAGNIGSSEDSPPLQDIGTPTLKSEVYTTGRGGTGNMAKNENADVARLSQDVDVPAQRLAEGPTHTGRGGAANAYKPTQDELDANREHNRLVEQATLRETNEQKGVKGLADRGKDFLFGRKH